MGTQALIWVLLIVQVMRQREGNRNFVGVAFLVSERSADGRNDCE